jgi:hypothetical protein
MSASAVAKADASSVNSLLFTKKVEGPTQPAHATGPSAANGKPQQEHKEDKHVVVDQQTQSTATI